MFCCNVVAEFEWFQANTSKLPTCRKPRCLLVLFTQVKVSEQRLILSAGIRNPVSLFELSCQLSVMEVEVTAIVARLEGDAGSVDDPEGVVTQATELADELLLEACEHPERRQPMIGIATAKGQ